MKVAIAIILTTVLASITIVNKRKKRFRLSTIRFRQTLMHEAVKGFLPKEAFQRNAPTQAKRHKQKNTIRIVKTPDNKVYWVKDNVFYWANMIDGGFDPNEGKPINTESLSKKELDKLLFILDTLENG